jgi:hypothetical protein
MRENDAPPWRRQALAAAIQWALALGALASAAVDLAAAVDSLNGPTRVGFVFGSDQWSYMPPASALVGAVLGYRWISEGFGDRSAAAHRRRVRFLGASLLAEPAALVGHLAVGAAFGHGWGPAQAEAVQIVFAVLPLLVAILAGYRSSWFPSPSTPAGL